MVDLIKQTLAKTALLSYLDYSSLFEMYTNALTSQLGAVIMESGMPLAFFSRKLSDSQCKDSVTKLEPLFIVECLKELKSMLWGQNLQVFTDHKNLTQDASGMTCDRVYCWRLLLEYYGPEIVYLEGHTNVVSDVIGCLEFNDTHRKHVNVHKKERALVILLRSY